MLTQTLSKKLQLSLNHDLQVTQGWTYQRYQEPSPVPEGSSMMIICISGSTSNVDNHIIDTGRMDLNNITPASYYACISVLSIRFPWNTVMLMWNSCTPRHLLRSFFGLIVKISARFPNNMTCRVKPPSSGKRTQYYSFDEADIDQDLGYP